MKVVQTLLFMVMVAAVSSAVAVTAFMLGKTSDAPLVLPSDFMDLAISVKDADDGREPLISFEREAHQTIRATWTVEVNTQRGEPVCSASGSQIYEMGTRRFEDKPLFSWFMRLDNPRVQCESAPAWPLPAGCYVVDLIIETRSKSGGSVFIPASSNLFCTPPVDHADTMQTFPDAVPASAD